MKISTKGIYAIDAMLDLAMNSKSGVESLKSIAERRALSDKYLEQIIGSLRKSGLVTSVRGAGGGYRLSKPANEITVQEILEAVESNLIPMECLHTKSECGIVAEKCVSKILWANLWEVILDITSSVTLQALMDESDRFKKEEVVEYYI